jgi:hypothetical protein
MKNGSKMQKSDRILKRVSKALDRAIFRKIPTDKDDWCRVWSMAYQRQICTQKEYKRR